MHFSTFGRQMRFSLDLGWTKFVIGHEWLNASKLVLSHVPPVVQFSDIGAHLVDKAEIQRAVDTVFSNLMNDRGTTLADIDPDRGLYEDGYGLDSMDTATLSAMLSERFEDDPYTAGIFPRNIAEIVEYYAGRVNGG